MWPESRLIKNCRQLQNQEQEAQKREKGQEKEVVGSVCDSSGDEQEEHEQMDRTDHTTEEAVKLGKELPANTPVPGVEHRKETGRAKGELEGSSQTSPKPSPQARLTDPRTKRRGIKEKNF